MLALAVLTLPAFDGGLSDCAEGSRPALHAWRRVAGYKVVWQHCKSFPSLQILERSINVFFRVVPFLFVEKRSTQVNFVVLAYAAALHGLYTYAAAEEPHILFLRFLRPPPNRLLRVDWDSNGFQLLVQMVDARVVRKLSLLTADNQVDLDVKTACAVLTLSLVLYMKER